MLCLQNLGERRSISLLYRYRERKVGCIMWYPREKKNISVMETSILSNWKVQNNAIIGTDHSLLRSHMYIASWFPHPIINSRLCLLLWQAGTVAQSNYQGKTGNTFKRFWVVARQLSTSCFLCYKLFVISFEAGITLYRMDLFLCDFYHFEDPDFFNVGFEKILFTWKQYFDKRNNYI